MRDLPQWLEFISGQHWQTIDMGLQRMQTMVERLKLNQPAPQIITVAGTNGKGSTCVACEALLLNAGLNVGTTLSPHVTRFNERIRYNATEVDDVVICDAFTEIERQRAGLPLTYFEFSALAALWVFKQMQVDVAILEIGLGGRLDAFNVIDADVAVVTSIGLDHQQFLGDTLDAIGTEKAGILRPGQHVLLGPDMPQSVFARCRALELDPLQVGTHWTAQIDATGRTWSVVHAGQIVAEQIPMGHCAPQNFLLAYLAAKALTCVDVTCLAEVYQQVRLPGRMQILKANQRSWLLDVAHNPAAAEFLVRQLQQRHIVPKAVVCGMLADKDHKGVFKAISQAFDVPWFLLDTAGERGLSASSLRATLPETLQVNFSSQTSLVEDLSSATQPGDVILVLGSFYVVEQTSQRLCTFAE